MTDKTLEEAEEEREEKKKKINVMTVNIVFLFLLIIFFFIAAEDACFQTSGVDITWPSCVEGPSRARVWLPLCASLFRKIY